MVVIKCPNCNSEIEMNISNAIDSEGEVFICPKCRQILRYVES